MIIEVAAETACAESQFDFQIEQFDFPIRGQACAFSLRFAPELYTQTPVLQDGAGKTGCWLIGIGESRHTCGAQPPPDPFIKRAQLRLSFAAIRLDRGSPPPGRRSYSGHRNGACAK